MSTTKLLVVLLILSAFVSPIFILKAHASSEDLAVSAISQAEEALASAYEAVLEAEQAGANVSSLLARLNDAGRLLAKAQVAYRLADVDEATHSANLCYEISKGVRSDANEPRIGAYETRVMGFWLTMTGSLVGVVAVVFGSFLGWRAFKRRYYRRMLRTKPEVAKNES